MLKMLTLQSRRLERSCSLLFWRPQSPPRPPRGLFVCVVLIVMLTGDGCPKQLVIGDGDVQQAVISR